MQFFSTIFIEICNIEKSLEFIVPNIEHWPVKVVFFVFYWNVLCPSLWRSRFYIISRHL